jgi:class 3 adenylate cyclase/tetratricopeptide (TPR) repeat protein
VICSNCGTENRPGAKFCTECATPFGVTCPNCGTVNTPTAKFCAECATPLGAIPAPGQAVRPAGSKPTVADAPVSERRLVSILFADLVGFTTFAEGRDSEEVRETLSRYFDLAREVIGRYGGTVEKFIGDAVMAVWGAPVAQEDDAERAVRAGLELVDAVRTLGPGIQARCGVLTGEAAVTLGATNQGMVAGDIVNTASRLQSAAQPGWVLVGEATERSASSSIVFEPAGEQVLKGKASPVPAWRAVRVIAERGGRNRSDAIEAPFVGRDEELRQLKDLFHAAARERKPRLVSVIGPAGIGKSRLAWEFTKYIDGLSELVYWHTGRSPAYGDGITFWALGEMVRARAGLRETDDDATSRQKIAAIVRTFVPDPEEQGWIESALLALLGLETGVGSEQLFAAWRTFFERLATATPVVMVFEDLHHADAGLLDFIDHLMDWSRGVPITVLTLARPELLDRRPDWGAGKRTFAGIHLEPLPPDAMRALLTGLAPGLPDKAVEAIVARAEGVPLYGVETVRMLLAQGRVVFENGFYRPTGELGDLAIPETLTALIAARLDGLEATDRELIADAAVLGQSFTLAGVSAVSGIEKAALEPRLLGLVRRELLVLDANPRSPERGQFLFVQALVREVAYNTLAKKDRKVRHLAAARFFESLGTDELAGGLASHYLAAQRLAADPDEAAALAVQARIALRGAAERAAALGSFEQSLKFLDQAIEVTTDPVELADLHRRASTVATDSASANEAIRHAEAALEAVRQLGDRPAVAEATARLSLAITRNALDPTRGLEVIEAGWAEFADLEETPAGVSMMLAFGYGYGFQDNPEVQLEWSDRLLPVAERLDLLEPLVQTLMGRGAALARLDRTREGLVVIGGAHRLAIDQGLGEVELTGRILLTFFEQWGSPGTGVALAREGLEIARRRASRRYTMGMIGNGTVCAIRVGEWDWAASAVADGIATEAGEFPGFAEIYSDHAVLVALRGGDPTADLEKVVQLRSGVTDPQYESYERWARAWAALSTGDYGQAIVHSEAAIRSLQFFKAFTWPLAARAAMWAGDLENARRLVDLMDDTAIHGSAFELDRVVARAGVAALEGRTTDAVSGYRDGIRGYQALGLAFDAALTAVDVAVVLPVAERSSGELAAAIEAAAATFERLGAKPFSMRLAEALAAEAAPERRREKVPAPSI